MSGGDRSMAVDSDLVLERRLDLYPSVYRSLRQRQRDPLV